MAGCASPSSSTGSGSLSVPLAVSFARCRGLAAAPFQVGQSDRENEQRADRAEDRGRPGVGLEEGRRDDVLDLRRSGQRVHGEGEGAERDRAGDQALGDVALAEHLGRERIDREDDHEQRHAAIGQHGADQHDRQHGALLADEADDRRDDRLGKAGQLDHLAEHGAEQEDRKIQLHEADHLVHEQAGEDRRHGGGVGQQHGEQGRHGSEQDNAEAAVGHEHQKDESGHGDQKAHGQILHFLGQNVGGLAGNRVGAPSASHGRA